MTVKRRKTSQRETIDQHYPAADVRRASKSIRDAAQNPLANVRPVSAGGFRFARGARVKTP